MEQLADYINEMFQSTLPTRGATVAEANRTKPYEFQSTLPTRGATCIVTAAPLLKE